MRYFKTILLAFIITAGFFGFGGFHKAKAVQCSVDFDFRVTPTEVGLNGDISISGWVKSKNYNSQNSLSGAGYCNIGLLGGMVTSVAVVVSDNNLSFNPLTYIQRGISGQTDRITKSFQIPLNRYDNTSQLPFGPLSVNPAVPTTRLGTIIPGYNPGESFTLYAWVVAIPSIGGTGLPEVLSEATPITVSMKNQTYACLTANSSGQYVYACSPGRKSNLSDVPNNACSGKTPEVIDMDQCGKGKVVPTFACVATDNKYACSTAKKSDCSDTTGCSAENKAKCQQISSDKCGTIAGSPGAATGTTPSVAPGTTPSAATDALINPLPIDNLTGMFMYIVKGFLAIIGILGVLFVIVGGFRMVIAAGNEEQYIAAKKTITWAILGVVIAVMSFSIMAIVQNLIGVDYTKIQNAQPKPEPK